MSFIGAVTSIINPVSELIDNVHTSDEERAEAKIKLYEMQSALFSKALEFEKSLLEARSAVLKVESQGDDWLQKRWRPITMLTFVILIVCDSFGLLANPLNDSAWLLLQIGIGGYIGGRSAEKLIPKAIQVVTDRLK